MTCFWDGILHHLKDEDFQRVFQINKPTNKNFVKILKSNLRKTKNIIWNGETLTDKQLEENYEHIKDFNADSIHGGYLCSTCEPFLFLVCELFKMNINHNYCGHMMSYKVNNSIRTLNFKSNSGHFSAC